MGGKSSTISTSEQRILSLQVQQSSQGLTLPVVYGRARVAGNLVWYGDFTTYEHKTKILFARFVAPDFVQRRRRAARMAALAAGETCGAGHQLFGDGLFVQPELRIDEIGTDLQP